jgi:hypothetical protein
MALSSLHKRYLVRYFRGKAVFADTKMLLYLTTTSAKFTALSLLRQRSYEALRQLQAQGFDNAVGLQGGVAALKKAGLVDLG